MIAHGSPTMLRAVGPAIGSSEARIVDGQTDRRDERSGEAVGYSAGSSSQQPCGGHRGPFLAGHPPPMGRLPTLHRCPIGPLLSLDRIIHYFLSPHIYF